MDSSVREFLPHTGLQVLLDVLREAGYRCVGPQLRDGAIVYDTLERVDSLPGAVRDRQAPGRYRLESHHKSVSPRRRFAWANGPQALKPVVFPSREPLWQVQRDTRGELRFAPVREAAPPTAVLGVRACDLAALRLLDAHFLSPAIASGPDPAYAARREGLFLIGVECSHPAATCFCAATGDGPHIATGDTDADLVLAELDNGYLITADSHAGETVLERLRTQVNLRAATRGERMRAQRQVQQAAQCQHRGLPGHDEHGDDLRGDRLATALFARQEHAHWEAVAQRCLACGNCTSVCPTCFCHNETEQPVLDGSGSVHSREWDSCFSEGHSYIHGIVIRSETRQRYRQWLTHKLGGWYAQYGRSGCVGCGRCITWCPVGIDLTAEVAAVCGAGQNEGHIEGQTEGQSGEGEA